MRYHTWSQQGNQIVQSAYGRLTFYEEPVFVFEYGDRVVLVCRNATNGYSIIEYSHRDLTETDIGYEPHLDRRETITGGSPSPSPTTGNGIYHESMDWTEFQHTGRDASLTESRLVTDYDTEGKNGGVFRVPVYAGVHTDLGGTVSSAFFAGRWDNNGDHWFGFKFDTEFVLTDLWPGSSARRPLVSILYIFHKDTTDYKLTLTVDNRITVYVSPWQALVVGASIIGDPAIATGYSEHLVQEDPRRIELKISSSSPGPMQIPSLEYRMKVKRR